MATYLEQLEREKVREANSDSVAYMYWILLSISALAPIVIFILIVVRRPAIMTMLRSPLRYRSYGLRQLERHGQPRYSLCYFFIYRHRPLVMEFFKVAVEFSFMAHFFDSSVMVRAPLITWCIYDVMAVAFLINLRDLKNRSGSGQGAKMAYWIFVVYTIAFGFPMGSATKVLWIFHVENGLKFHYVLLPYFCGAGTLLLILLFYLCPTSCFTKRDRLTLDQFYSRMYLIFFFFLMFIMWGWVFLNVEYCKVPSELTDRDTWFDEHDNCPQRLDSYTAAFLPVSMLLIFFNMFLSWVTTKSGLLWRFLPEVVSMWSVAITFLTVMYYMDKGDARILFPAILVMGLSAIVTLMSNMSLVYIVIYTVRYVIPIREQEIAEGRRSRHFTEDQKKKNRETRDAMLQAFLKSKGKTPTEGSKIMSKIKSKDEGKKLGTLKGTLFRQMWVQSRDQMSRCCICFEDYSGNKDEIILAIIKKCGHYFHYDCVWDWLEKRPTCPMCRQPVDLDDTGIRVLSYFDIKHAIRVNRPADADAQSAISSVSGRTDAPNAETNVGSETSNNEGEESNLEPPVTLRPMIEATKAQNQTETASGGSSEGTPSTNRGPLPDIPVISTPEQNSSESRPVDVVVNVENNQQVPPPMIRQMSEPVGFVTSPDVAQEEGRRVRRTSETGRSGAHRRPSGTPSHGLNMHRPPYQRQDPRSRDMHYYGDSYHQQQHGRSRRPSESRSKSAHPPQQSQPSQQGQHRRPSTAPSHQVTAPPDTPHAHGKRQSRRRCEICGRRYEGDPRDIVVGYIRGCGHFYHCLCLDSYIRKHETCPRYHYEVKEARKRGQSAGPERRITLNEVFFAFLLDILHDTGADTQESTMAHSNGVGPRGRHNRGYVAEMQRF